MERPNTFLQVTVGDKLGVFTSDEEKIAKALLFKRTSLGENFINGKSHAIDRIIARETAVRAVIDALIRQIERSEEANDFAKAPAGHRLGATAKFLDGFAGRRRNQAGEIR